MVIKNSPLSLAQLTARHGIPRSKLYHAIYNYWELAPLQISVLSLYRRIDMHGSSFKNYLRNGMFYFFNPETEKMVHFNIVYNFCGPVSIRHENITVSLRIAHADYNIEPVALVHIKGSKYV